MEQVKNYTDFWEELRSEVFPNKKNNQDNVNHPSHYNQGSYEVIEEMRLLFGDKAVRDFCRLNAYKYFRRAEYKGNPEEDKRKAEWYLNYIDKLNKETVWRDEYD